MNKKPAKKSSTEQLLNEMQLEMRNQVIELELKARYWKAQFELRYYTLEANKIAPEYESHLKAEAEKNQKLQEEYLAQMEKNKEAGVEILEGVPEDIQEANL